MRRLIATVALIGGALFLHSALTSRPTRDNVALAENPDAQSLSLPFSSHESRSIPTTSRSDSVAHGANVRTSAKSENATLVAANRFDRGRLNEEYDGEMIRKRSSRAGDTIAAATHFVEESPVMPPAAGVELAQLELAQLPTRSVDGTVNGDNPFAGAAPPTSNRKPHLIPIPRRTSGQNRTANANDLTPNEGVPRDTHSGSSQALLSAVESGVTLIINPDHQIRILAEAKTPPELLMHPPAGTLVISADEFNLVPPAELGARIQLTCSGRVQVRSQLFFAQCAKLFFKDTNLVLEGSAHSRVEIRKQATGNASEFQLSADKISFTLSLDKIQIGDGVTISPPATNGPGSTPVPHVPMNLPLRDDVEPNGFSPTPAPAIKPSSPSDFPPAPEAPTSDKPSLTPGLDSEQESIPTPPAKPESAPEPIQLPDSSSPEGANAPQP